MTTAYFSFGQSHVHSVDGFTYDKDVLVKIRANDPRARMFEVFGGYWSMLLKMVEDGDWTTVELDEARAAIAKAVQS